MYSDYRIFRLSYCTVRFLLLILQRQRVKGNAEVRPQAAAKGHGTCISAGEVFNVDGHFKLSPV